MNDSIAQSEQSHVYSTKAKLVALSEVVIVRFVVYSLLVLSILQFAYGTVNPDPFPPEAPYLVGSLWFLIPSILILGVRRNRIQYGLSVEEGKRSIDLALNAFPFFVLTNAGFMLVIMMGWSYLEPMGALIITAFFIVSLILIVRMISQNYFNLSEIQISEKKHQTNLLVIFVLLLLPLILGFVLNRFSILLVSTVIWQFIFSGFGEEIFFRGYIQSRLNLAFGRPYEWKSIRFGPGLVITAAIFAITHMLNTANIWFGDFNLAWWWGTFTFVGGLLFGLLREKTQSVVAPGVLHGLEAVGEGLALLL
jgi:membrane protease YdiL (CAAX protease family)